MANQIVPRVLTVGVLWVRVRPEDPGRVRVWYPTRGPDPTCRKSWVQIRVLFGDFLRFFTQFCEFFEFVRGRIEQPLRGFTSCAVLEELIRYFCCDLLFYFSDPDPTGPEYLDLDQRSDAT